MNSILRKAFLSILIILPAVVLTAQPGKENVVSTAEKAIQAASTRIDAAKNLDAEKYAKALLDEAVWRLNVAKDQLKSGKTGASNIAMLRAVQAESAAEAAEAKARWLGSVAEVKSLRAEITGFGKSLSPVDFHVEPSGAIERGDTSASRIEFARKVLAQSRNAGASTKYAADLQEADRYLDSAAKAASASAHSTSADHLAYVAEMTARRAEYLTRLDKISALIPDLRVQRSELAKAAMEKKAAEERQQREATEKRMAEMRQKLDQERAQRNELRQQIETQETSLWAQLEADHSATVDAERKLDLLRARHETALARAKSVADAEPLRRKVEDQQILVDSLDQRELASEKAVEASLSRMSDQLAKDRESGVYDKSALDARSAELDQKRADLARMRKERIQDEYDRKHDADVYAQRVAASEKRLRESEAKAAQLEKQAEEERQRAAEAEARLKSLQEQMAKRQAEAKQRMAAMKDALTRIAPTRTNDRGQFVVSLTRLFDSGKTEIRSGARNEVAQIAALLRPNNDRIRVVAVGHTDSVGNDEANLKLSEARAKAVADFLVAEGLQADTVSSVGKGESEPVAPNDSAAGRQQNRRVDLVIVEMKAPDTTPEPSN